MAKITTDHEGWANAERVGVKFKNGEARTNDEAKLAFFRRHADVYTVHEQAQRRPQEPSTSQENSDGGDKPKGDGDKAGQGDGKGGDGDKDKGGS